MPRSKQAPILLLGAIGSVMLVVPRYSSEPGNDQEGAAHFPYGGRPKRDPEGYRLQFDL